jgi:HK97 family phage prohead protease
MTEPIYRDFDFEIRDTSEAGDGRSFSGYAALFNSPTTISGWEGNFRETIKPGAFKKTLQDRKPVLMYGHGKHAAIGDLPLGIVTRAREDERGLHIEARLHGSEIFAPVREALASGALSKMSFRFEPIKEQWSPKRDERTLLEVRVPEVSVVLFPAYAGTEAQVRANIEKAAQMTRSERLAAVARLKAGTTVTTRVVTGRQSTRAERMAQVRALKTGSPKRIREMDSAERIALAARYGVTINGPRARAQAAADARNPWAAKIRREQEAADRAAFPRRQHAKRVAEEELRRAARAFSLGLSSRGEVD